MASKGTSAVLAVKEFWKRLSWRTYDTPSSGDLLPSPILTPSLTLLVR